MNQAEHDHELVCWIASGNEAALQELYAVYGQRMYAYALRLTDDSAMAEDVVQETFIVVWKTASRYRSEGRLLAWLLGIVHNLAFKAIRRRVVPITEELECRLPAVNESPEEQALASEKANWVRQGLQDLSTEHRAVVELVFYQGLTLAEAAQVCQCPTSTVKSRLSYARQHLKGVLSRQNMEDWR